jgi:glycogen phosphorylase
MTEYSKRKIAYFSMEIAVNPGMPTYSGGLGMLAGDTIRSAADLKVPIVAVSLLHRKGYFYQRLDPNGWQREEPAEWVVEDFLIEMPERVSVVIEGRSVQIRAWKYVVTGIADFEVPVYLLDTYLPENSESDKTLTHYLYGGDQRYRLCQEVILGTGGVRMLRALGYRDIGRFHMNEGHSSLLTLELLNEESKGEQNGTFTIENIESVKKRCVFTTHTPVPAGHDQFPLEIVNDIIGLKASNGIKDIISCNGVLNMTYLALNLSSYINGVAKKHGETSNLMFDGYHVDAITNGIHAPTWVSNYFKELFDRYAQDWMQDNFNLRYALNIPKSELWDAHVKAKKELINHVNRETNVGLDLDHLTIGLARRATRYKRTDLIFTDIERLKGISTEIGPLQIIISGKAHPKDHDGKELIHRIYEVKELLQGEVKISYLENYDMVLSKMIIAGVDVWLNTPQPPLEASGTSGMKAALNGVPSLSVLDGWWIEGCIEGITGWSIGENGRKIDQNKEQTKDASSLYQKLEQVVLPLFYNDRDSFIDVMRNAIALNASFFNTQRMLKEYVLRAYLS